MPDFRSDRTWQDAIALGPVLMELAEAMPATEELGLSWQLRKSMVRLPAAIAVDLHGEGSGRMPEYYRLVATLELIDKVYPALDTVGAKSAVDKLGERLSSSAGDGRTHGKLPALKPHLPEQPAEQSPEPPAVSPPHPSGTLAGPDAATSPAQPAAAAPEPVDKAHPAPASVPVLEEPSHPSVSVPVLPNHEAHRTDVQPDSSQ